MNISLDSLFSFSYMKGYTLNNFSHSTHELIYLINGEGKITLEESDYTYHGNSIFFCHSGDKRDFVCFKKTDYICIRFTGDLKELSIPSGIYDVENEQIFYLFKKVKEEYQEKKYHYFMYCNIKIEEILLLIIRCSHIINPETEYIYKLIRQINSNLSFSQSVGEMAEYSGYSYDHFRHKFKQITGVPPAEYIQNKKIENACMFLKSKKLICSEISELCGFSSPSQFSTLFKNKFGITPKQYLTYISEEKE